MTGTERPSITEFVEGADWLGLSISPAQRVLLKAIYGLALTDEEHALWTRCTGRQAYPGMPFEKAVVVAGARSGKDSRIACPVAVYESVFGGHEAHAAKGEIPVIPLVAPTERSTAIAFGYIQAYFTESALLRQMLAEPPREREVRLTNGLRVVCFACTGRGLRGWSFPAAVLDEVSFFRLEAANDTDREIEVAIERGQVSFPHPKLLLISTPYAKTGLLWENYTRYFGHEDAEVLVWQAATDLMNPSISPDRLAKRRRADAARSSREYDALFQDDVSSFFPAELLEAATVAGRRELPPQPGIRYLAAVDPSGGTGADAFTLAIVHVEHRDGRPFMVQDVARGWNSPRGQKLELAPTVGEIAAVLARYGLYRVVGDKYAGEWPIQEFRKCSVLYEQAARDKSSAYVECEPWVTTGSIELLDHPELLREAGLLEKRLRAGGKKALIDHPRGAHDDHINALALAVSELAKSLAPACGGMAETFLRAAAKERGAEPPPTREMGFFREMPDFVRRSEPTEDERVDEAISMVFGRGGRLRMFR